jgi:hypothetical protein
MQYVLDGEDFSLEVRYADGTAARAYGSNAFPDGYHEVMARLDDVLQQEKMTRIAGTYCLENSELTLTLQADGTYAFSGSQSGQEPDSGTWYTYLDMIDLSEDAEEGLEFSFGYDEPYHTVSSGECHFRSECSGRADQSADAVSG